MSSTNIASPGSRAIQDFFDGIASRYDFLNNILSFQMDEGWRKKSRDLVFDPAQKSILDLGIGTGKFLKLFLEKKKWTRAAGLDFSAQMLEEARRQLPPDVELVKGDFHDLPFPAANFDLIVSAFTLRSIQDMPVFLKGVYQILTPQGTAAFLCLTRPRNFFFKLIYYPYLKIYLPLLGGMISGNRGAYEFLSSSILSFQEPEQTVLMMKQIGFNHLEIRRFTFGAATLIIGKKGSA